MMEIPPVHALRTDQDVSICDAVSTPEVCKLIKYYSIAL